MWGAHWDGSRTNLGALWCSLAGRQCHSPAARNLAPGGAASWVLPPSLRDRRPRAPLASLGGGQALQLSGGGAAAGLTGLEVGPGSTPKASKGRACSPPPSIQGAHPCQSPMGAGQWLQTPPQELLRASWRWEMAPCHHGNGATGLPCRGDGHVRSPVERSTGASRAPSTGHQPRAPSCHLPSTLWPRHRAHLLLLHHPPHQDATPAGCHPGRMPPGQDVPLARRCSSWAARHRCSRVLSAGHAGLEPAVPRAAER